MYNPSNNDNYYEWIELYNPTNNSINLTDWSIKDNYETDIIIPNSDDGNGSIILPAKQYAIITDQGTKIYETNISTNSTLLLYVDDANIGNGLGNNNDFLILKNKSNGIIDAVEWGEDSTEVNGQPIHTVKENNSVARYSQKDTNNSTTDFYEAINPTPGEKNNESSPGSIIIEMKPDFLAKPYHFQQYALPIGLQVTFQDYDTLGPFDLKTFISGKNSSQPASQTWTGTNWQYSDRYTHQINPSQKSYSIWLYLRLNKSYKAYQDFIKNNETAQLHVKIRYHNQSEQRVTPITLLDMDNSTTNATSGGYIVNRAITNKKWNENNIILLKNSTNKTTSIYRTENNTITESFSKLPGYYKLAAPVGKNYSLFILNENQSIIQTKKNITIRYGHYDVALQSTEQNLDFDKRKRKTTTISLQNTGDFNDTYQIQIDTVTNGWNVHLNKKTITLSANESTAINLNIQPASFEKQIFSTSEITIKAQSTSDPGLSDEITYFCTLIEPDLTIPNIKSYDIHRNESSIVAEGRSIRIKAYCKNTGNENASDVTVSFYLDHINESMLLGTKHYDTISKYQKYPSYLWDTHNVAPGEHTIWVVVDKMNSIAELDETNNQGAHTITIQDTRPSKNETKLLITELYVNTHSGLFNEYFCIHNPTNQNIPLTDWYLTTTPFKKWSDQQKIIFPENTSIQPHCTLTITQNATTYHFETDKKADFEYHHDANTSIPQMIYEKTIYFSNNGETITLKDSYNHTIDAIHYGNTHLNCSFWQETPIPLPKTGEILLRKTTNYQYIDTNTSKDWGHPRSYRIGQSRFSFQSINCTGNVTTFVSPDCSYNAIKNELDQAEESIYINIYEIAHPDLCNTLIDALRRKVSVTLFIEGGPIGGMSDEQRLFLHRISNYGANIRCIKNNNEKNIFSRYAFDHAKYIIIDNHTTIVESCNWMQTGVPTDTDSGNREWGIIIKNKTLAAIFLMVFMDDYNPKRADSISFQQLNLSLPPTTFLKKHDYYGYYQPSFKPKTIQDNCTILPVFSPDNSKQAICSLIESAKSTIYVQQLYIYKNWDNTINPFVEALVNKSEQGLEVKVILNYNPRYDSTNIKINETKTYLQNNGINVKLFYTNWSLFTNIHNKGIIVDNKSTLISSINWNENSVMNNREAGIIVTNNEIAQYYANVFFTDWQLNESTKNTSYYPQDIIEQTENKHTIYIVSIFTMTIVLIARDWRKRRWT